jgi:hypothetical protein
MSFYFLYSDEISFPYKHIIKLVKVKNMEPTYTMHYISKVFGPQVDNLMIMYFIIIARNNEVIKYPIILASFPERCQRHNSISSTSF